jgi:hypothetical protein
MRSLTLTEEHKLQGFENKVPSKINGHKKNEVSVQFRILHEEEFRCLYMSPFTVENVSYA